MTISLCVIAYNEEVALPRLLGDVRQQTYPADQTEVILVNSGSQDQTLAVMEAFAASNPQYRRVKVIDAGHGNQASSWNAAIREAREDVIIRIDAHARIPADFVEKNVACLQNGEDVSGGPRDSLPEKDTPWQRLLLAAESSMFGSGIASFRRESGRRYVNSMFHAAYRREVFEKAGLFNESLGRTEDNEMHYRIRKAGYRLCYDPSIHSSQYVRSTVPGMLKQKFGNGYWVSLTLKVCPQCLGIYHFVPLGFVLGILVTTVRAALGKPRLAIAMWASYWCAAVAMAVAAVRRQARHICQFFLPVLFFLLHISYGLGSLAGLLRLPFWQGERNGGSRSGEWENG